MIIKTVFKIHRIIFNYPCRSNIRLALEQKQYTYDLSWRVGMLYICGESITAISEWTSMDEKDIIIILNKLSDGVIYE